jgi:putative peptidoglycan lipid II flippase
LYIVLAIRELSADKPVTISHAPLQTNWREILYPLLAMCFPVLVVALVSHWPTLVMNRELTKLGVGTLATVAFAYKLLTLLVILPTSYQVIAFPALSKADIYSGIDAFRKEFAATWRASLLLALAPLGWVFAEKTQLVTLLYGGGAMSENDIASIAQALGHLLWSLPAVVTVSLMGKMYFSLRRPKIPAITTAIGAALTTIIMPTAATQAGIAGIIFSFVGISWLMAIMLVAIAWREELLASAENWLTSSMALAATVGLPYIAALFVSWAASTVFIPTEGETGPLLAHLVLTAIASCIALIIVAWLCRFPELQLFNNVLQSSTRRRHSGSIDE